MACCQKENTALMLKEEQTGTPSHCHSFSLSYFCKSPTTWDPFKDKQSSCTTCLQSIHVHITIILEGHGEAPLMASHPPSCLPPNSSPPLLLFFLTSLCEMQRLSPKAEKHREKRRDFSSFYLFNVGSDVGFDSAQMLLLLSLG